MKYRSIFAGLSLAVFFASTSTSAAKDIHITVLYDNYAHQEGLETDWGFACLVEGLNKTILFDTGMSGTILLANAKKLNVDLREVDVVIISHDHKDHYGGLDAFLEVNPEVGVYLLEAFDEERSATVRKRGAKTILVKGAIEICRDAWLTGSVGFWIKEQALVIDTALGAVLITGCAHPGIVPMVKKAKTIVPPNVHMVCGGFHMGGKSDAVIRKTLRAFKDLGVNCAGPSHCSGEQTIDLFQQAYGDHFVQLGVGQRLVLSLAETKP